jgi:hypothetical protein
MMGAPMKDSGNREPELTDTADGIPSMISTYEGDFIDNLYGCYGTAEWARYSKRSNEWTEIIYWHL